MKDKIIAAIAAYLEKETKVTGFRNDRHRVEFGGTINRGHFTHSGFCQEIATEIAAAIAPLVEAGGPNWKNAPDWADYWTLDYAKKEAWHEEFPRIEYDKVIRRPRD